MISPNTSSFIYLHQQRLVYKKTQYTPEFVLQLRREVFFSVLKYMVSSSDEAIADFINRLKRNFDELMMPQRTTNIIFAYCLITSLEFVFELIAANRAMNRISVVQATFLKEYFHCSSEKIKNNILISKFR